MLGSYIPNPTGEPHTKTFDTEESPSGVIARSGMYSVRSRVVDDDGEVYAGTPPAVHLCPRIDRLCGRLGVVLQARKGVVNTRLRLLCFLKPHLQTQ
jgi:hypothetical protein